MHWKNSFWVVCGEVYKCDVQRFTVCKGKGTMEHISFCDSSNDKLALGYKRHINIQCTNMKLNIITVAA